MAEESSHVPAPTAVSPALPRDSLSLYEDDDDQFNSHSEEHQDLAPDTEIHSNASDIHSNSRTLGLQQMRREAAIESAPKGSLTTEAKRKLRLTPFTSKLLFDGQIGDIYKENVTENHEILVKKAVTNQAKPNPSAASSRKPKAKSGKNKPKPQETPKKDFPFPPPRPPRGRNSSRGSSSRGRGACSSHRGASASRKH